MQLQSQMKELGKTEVRSKLLVVFWIYAHNVEAVIWEQQQSPEKDHREKTEERSVGWAVEQHVWGVKKPIRVNQASAASQGGK